MQFVLPILQTIPSRRLPWKKFPEDNAMLLFEKIDLLLIICGKLHLVNDTDQTIVTVRPNTILVVREVFGLQRPYASAKRDSSTIVSQ